MGTTNGTAGRSVSRSRLAAAAAVFLGVIALAVLGAASAQAKHDAGPVTLTFWSGLTGGDHATYVALVNKFNATHPRIKVVVTYEPWDSIAQKLPTAIASGSGPDIATPDYNVGTVRQYIKNGLLAPIDGMLGKGPNQVDPSVIAPAIKSAFTVNGHLYAAPANWSTLRLYWNQTLFAQAGISGPPKTMAQLISDAKKLTTGGRFGIAIADNNTAPMWPILIWAGGGDIVNAKGCSALGSASTISAVSTFASAIHQDGITQVGLSGQDADNLFAAQKAAMEINGPWAAGEYIPTHVKFGIAAVPVGSTGKPVTAALTVPMVVNAKSKHVAQAETFFSWFLSKPTQVYLAIHANYPPARTDMAKSAGLAHNPLAAGFAAETPYARLFLPGVAAFSQVNTDIFTPAIQAVERGADVASTLQSASQKLIAAVNCMS
ncbi:MAG: multiple sugar transport system substrate-binding protein [Actinomycetota bacterium]|nr:multiple sugar transport system substrate-binding protein [Actinomycetota bacterium]